MASYLSLDEAAGSSGQTLATQAVTGVVESLNFIGSELWTKLQKSGFSNLLELSVRTSVVVRTFPILVRYIVFPYYNH